MGGVDLVDAGRQSRPVPLDLAGVQVTVVMVVIAGHLVDQVIHQLVQRHAVLVVRRVRVAQVLDRRLLLRDLVFAENDRKRSAAAIGTLHLRLEAAHAAGSRAM